MPEEREILYRRDCYLVIDRAWPGAIGTLEISSTDVTWLPRGEQNARRRPVVIPIQCIEKCEVLPSHWLWGMKPVALSGGGYGSMEMTGCHINLHETRARLTALFWLANISIFLGVVGYVGLLSGSFIGAVIFIIWLLVLARTMATAVPLVLAIKD
jgi:hypothetical protein